MSTRTLFSIAVATAFALLPASAGAQHRTTRHRRSPAAPAPASGPSVPSAHPNLDLGEVIPEAVTAVDGNLRRMRVFLFTAPAASTAFGVGALGEGLRLWALLPSCRTTNPDDHREPCPVDRVTVEAVVRGNVNAGTPTYLGGVVEGRRVQSFVVQSNAPRVRLRVLGSGNRIRYEAVVEAARLVDLAPPEGTPTPDGFTFDLTRYPAR